MGSALLSGGRSGDAVGIKTPTSGKFAFLKQPALHGKDEFQIYARVTSQLAEVGVSLSDSWEGGGAVTNT